MRLPARSRGLLAVAAGVLAVHLLLLQATPGSTPVESAFAQALLTRTITVEPSSPALRLAADTVSQPRPPPSARRAVVAPAPREQAVAVPISHPAPPADASAVPTPDLLAQAAPAPAQHNVAPTTFDVPGPVRLHYRVTARTRIGTLEGTSQLHWRHDGSEYEARLELSAPLLPTRTQYSAGRITVEGLAPLRFSDKARSEEAAHFDRDRGRVSFSSNRPDVPLLPGAQDRLSVLLQLAAMAAGEPALLRPGATVGIQTAGTRDAEVWTFAVEAEKQLQLPGGAMGTLKLTRQPRKEYDQKVELWLAPGMDYVPVRLRLTQANGDWVDQQWSSTDKG